MTGDSVKTGSAYTRPVAVWPWRKRHPDTSPQERSQTADNVTDAIDHRETVVLGHLCRGRRPLSAALVRVATQVLPTLLGIAAGVYFIATSPLRGAPQWEAWAALWIAQIGAAGAVFTFGINRLRELPREERPPAAARAALLVVLVAGAALTIGLVYPVWHHYGWKGPATVVVSFAGAVPAAVTALLMRRAANSASWPKGRSPSEQVSWLLDRRQLLRSLLVTVGSLVALQMFTLGALGKIREALASAGTLPAAGIETPVTVVIAGALGSLIIGVAYALAAVPLQRRGRQLSKQMFELAREAEPGALLAQIENRQKFQTLLGANTNLFSDLQSGLLILAPLAASSATTFFSG